MLVGADTQPGFHMLMCLGVYYHVRNCFDKSVDVRFRDVSICARCYSLLYVRVVSGAGIENDRSVRVKLAYLATEFKAVDSREPAVKDKEIEALRSDQWPGFSG